MIKKFLFLLLLSLCLALTECYAQTGLNKFMKATSDTTFNCEKFPTIACKAFGNAGQEAVVYFQIGGVRIGDTIRIDAGDSYTWFAIPPKTWGKLDIRMNTLTEFVTDSMGSVAPYVKCIAYR